MRSYWKQTGVIKLKRYFVPIIILSLVHMVLDGSLGSRLRGYHPVAPRPISCRPSVHRLLVLLFISRGAPCQVTWETSVSEGRNHGWEVVDQFGLRFRLPRKSQGFFFTCHKSVTWFYVCSEGRHAVDFFACDLGYHQSRCTYGVSAEGEITSKLRITATRAVTGVM
jgi:hypothetical protein